MLQFVSACCRSRDELIQQSFEGTIKAHMEVQQVSVMLHLLNASAPPRAIAPKHRHGSGTRALPTLCPRSKLHQAQIRHLFKL